MTFINMNSYIIKFITKMKIHRRILCVDHKLMGSVYLSSAAPPCWDTIQG